MFITGLGTAAPPGCYTQQACYEALQSSPQYAKLDSRSQAILRKVLLGRNGIETRHLALDSLADAFDISPDTLHARFKRHAPALATEAAERALADAGLNVSQVDAVLISTCTGYLCPGLTSYVSERLGLQPGTLGLDLVGQGCGAALPNLRTCEALLSSGQYRNVLSICVEICSAAMYLDTDPGVLISACLFGDGAGAAVLSTSPGKRYTARFVAAGSLLEPADRELLRFDLKEGLLRNILSPEVPQRAGFHAAKLLEQVTSAARIPPKTIPGWIFHPGGREVLAALQREMQLSEADLRHSSNILRRYGNLSSPSVYFVLQEALANGTPDGYWWMSSFGAGFSCHGALLEVSRS